MMWRLLLCCVLGAAAGCTSVRNTDPPRTATEQFLISESVLHAVQQISADSVRGHKIWVDTTYLAVAAGSMTQDINYLIASMRSHLLVSGAQITSKRDDAQIIIELRTGGLGIDRYEFLFGIPSLPIGAAVTASTGVPMGGGGLATPELAIIKNTRQWGVSSVAYVAYWADTGEVIGSSGPFVGRTYREDWWFFGAGPKSSSDIPTTKPLE